ncbi:isoleucine--tRNA ligase [candidate division LCP-89 bacterium B3_LCP]|uniref:Isoleucine--tRNA ligase n=1 Tax=candidate division LCP-89 bacterium B3_LCP TaxID=2012998 RepID=A0A532V009_UNCL8|nr:MAG: isoleucine--tRNA ligase [candidate division LCP-89 bacterium B3_LCP]
MFKTVEKSVKFPELEKRILKFWEDNDIQRKTDLQRENCPEFVFYDGPPGTNGKPHIGHMLQSALKDLWPRYKIMNGYHVVRKAGWDTHGLPIELTAEKELKLFSKKDIQKYGEEKYIEHCRSTVFRFKTLWEDAIKRIGRFLDMDDPYMTLTNDYIQSDWYLLKLAWERKLDSDRLELQGKEVSPRFLYRDYRILPYCARCGTSLSNFEVAEAYKDVQDITLTVKFPVKGEANTYFAAWTTTAWTLLSNVALAVGPSVDYVAVRLSEDTKGGKAGETIILAKERLEFYKDHLQPNEILWTKKGKELAGMEYHPLWDFQKDAKAHRVIADDYVTTEEGAGVVHLALYGEDDFRIIRREGLPLVQNVDDHGYCTEATGPYAGRYFKDDSLDIDILKDLHQRSLLLAKEKHEHAYPFCYRCDAALMYFARPGWFLRTASYSQEMQTANQHINWQPGHIKQGRFGNWLENTIDWNVTRERYWGSPFPVWTCDGPGCKGEVCIGSLTELLEAAGHDAEKILYNEKIGSIDLHKPLIDRIKIPCPECSSQMTREDFVLDSWFNAGLMFIGQWGYPATDGSKEILEKLYPADFICEAIDQTRGWFYTLLATSTLFATSNRMPEDKWSCYKNVICTELVLDDQGFKMSKSKGNVIDPSTLFEELGADATRWSFYTSNPWNVKRYSKEAVKECVRDMLLPMWNAYSFFVTYAQVDGWKPDDKESVSDHPLDRWLLGELTRLNQDVTAALEKYDVAPAAGACTKFLDQLTNWYIRRSRRRFWKSDDDKDKRNAYATLYHALTDFTLIIAPFLPFISEEIYQNLVRKCDTSAPESVHLASWPKAALGTVDEDLAYKMDLVRKIVRSGRDLRQKHQIKVRQPLQDLKVVIPDGDENMLDDLQDLIIDELNIKHFQVLKDDGELVVLRAQPNFKALGPRFGKDVNKAAKALRNLSEEQVRLLESGDEVEVNGTTFTSEDASIERAAPDDQAVSDAEGLIVALSLQLTPDLVAEGRAREIVHHIQNLRKQLDLDVTDRIQVGYQTDNDMEDAIIENTQWIMAETLAVEVSRFENSGSPDISHVKIDDIEVQLKIDKVETN